MPEIKNAFIASKMNKDLESRLIPSGEYRDAMNISVSQSEGSDVGSVQNIKGNKEILDIGSLYNAPNLEIIGFFMDERLNRIFVFSTDNLQVPETDDAPNDAKCFISVYNIDTGLTNLLIEGSFLNFSKRSLMTGVNLLEDLLEALLRLKYLLLHKH